MRGFLEEHVIPVLEGPRQFHARVAANILTIVDRELRDGEEQQRAEWRRLGALLCVPGDPAPPERASELRDGVLALTRELAARIRAGSADAGPFRAAVLAHLRATAEEKLRVANPRYLAEAS